MNERIQKLLERELGKLEMRSQNQIFEPLSPQDIKSLDVLIRAYRAFSAPQSPAVSPAADDPASQSTESLLNGLNNEQTK